MDDATLVARFRAGDEEAFDHLYRRHRDAAYRYALTLVGEAALAEDAVQTAFLRAFQALTGSERAITFRPWLLRITRNVCWDELRRRRVILLPPEDLPEPPAAGDLHRHEEAERRARAARVHQALRSLPPRYREVLVLRELMGLSYDELAHVLGCTLASVKVLLHRARLRFARRYESTVLAGARRGCRDLAELLSAYLDGALDDGAARRVERHVSDCPLCREEINRLRRVGELFALLPAPLLPASLLEAGRWAPQPLPGGAPETTGGEPMASGAPTTAPGETTATTGGTATAGSGGAPVAAGFSLANLATAAVLLGVVAGGGYLFGTPAGRQTLLTLGAKAPDPRAALSAVRSLGAAPAVPLEASFAGAGDRVTGLAPGQTIVRELTVRNPNERAASYRLTVEGTGDLFTCRPGPAPACDGGPAAVRVVRLLPNGVEEELHGWRRLPPGAAERLRVYVHLPAAAGPAYAGASGTLRVTLDQR